MAFSQRELNKGEVIKLHVRPHEYRAIIPAVIAAVGLGITILMYEAITNRWLMLALFAGLVAPILLPSLGAMLAVIVRWLTRRYLITNERIMIRSGLFDRRAVEARLSAIENVVLSQSLGQRIFRTGDIGVVTGNSEVSLYDVPSAGKVVRMLRSLMEGGEPETQELVAIHERTRAAGQDDSTDASVGHVFICYSRSDRKYVDRLASHLRTADIEVWYDSQVASGERFVQVLQNRIDTCCAVVVVMSPAALSSIWIEREVSYAGLQHKPILPLRLSGDKDHILLSHLNYEDIRGGMMPSDTFVDRLRHLQAKFLDAP